ncbi:MAG: patatin-like phospholipase family protein [Alphaproteobacteria bacterium]|nr:patatin-like phospholipase family protein [Alphaproteobacteria bacterium]
MNAKEATGRSPKMVNAALQGGGAHGAFTWGVLDRLLEDGRTGFEAISGTSAGAMNAVVVADGIMKGGPVGARQALEDFWQAVSREAAKSPIQRSLVNMFMGDWSLDTSPGYLFFDHLTRLVSPYQLNPLNHNPLRDLLEAQIDFDRVAACDRMKLFVSATNVHTGRVRVFTCNEITVDVIMASACLPLMFQAVEIDGVPYWDGGYMGNPALFPFFDSCASNDVILVQINPIERKTTPRTAREILNRMNEIAFNSSLLKELRAIEFVTRLIDEGKLDRSHYKEVLLHRVDGGEEMSALSASSKLNAEWTFLVHLRDLGRGAATRWLDESFDRVGKESSTDIRTLFEG